MSEIPNKDNHSKKWYQCHYRIIGIALLGILFLLVLGHLITYSLINKQRHDSTTVISNILTNASTEKSLIPDIIMINKIDSTISLDSTLKKDLITFLTNKFATNNSNSQRIFDIKPYLSISDMKDEDKIVKHIEFLANTVNKAVEESKANIDTEISKINTWVTIWIGVIGCIGIFLPIVINLKSFDDLKNIQADAKEAKEDSTNAKKISNDAKNIVVETENSFSLLIALYKLKDINYVFLAHQKQPLKVLVKYFEEIRTVLSNESIDIKHPFVLDALRQLASRLYELSTYPFVSKRNMILFNKLSEFITTRLETGMTEESFKEILIEFQNLISELKKS